MLLIRCEHYLVCVFVSENARKGLHENICCMNDAGMNQVCEFDTRITKGCNFPCPLCPHTYEARTNQAMSNMREHVLTDLRKIVCRLYDEGFKTPLVTFDAAVNEFCKEERIPNTFDPSLSNKNNPFCSD